MEDLRDGRVPVGTNDKAHFLNDEQKAVKQKIMEDCLHGLFDNLEKNQLLFDLQSAMDLVCSVLIMFNRDVLVHIFTTFDLQSERKEIMKNLFYTIRDEVNNKIKQGVM